VIKKLTKHGNSLALVVERPVLELLKIDSDTPLDISTNGSVLVISPVRDAKRRKEFDVGKRGQGRYKLRVLFVFSGGGGSVDVWNAG
jgi:antitoxin component of MazEF toxin-antitoxin module